MFLTQISNENQFSHLSLYPFRKQLMPRQKCKSVEQCYSIIPSWQTMSLSSQAISPTHGSTMLHSLVYIKNMHEPYKPIKFHPRKIYCRTRNWRATHIHNTLFHWLGRGHRGHAYLIENKPTSQGGPMGDERGKRWVSPVGYWGWVSYMIERSGFNLYMGFH